MPILSRYAVCVLSVITINEEAIISLQFTANMAEKPDSKVSLYWLDELANKWVELDNTSVDWGKGIVTGSTTHFTKFAILKTPVEATIQQPQEKDNSDVHFTDIQGHWAEENIEQMIVKGAVNGYPDRTFKPDLTITRAEFTAILVRALGLPLTEGKVFIDTAEHWASRAISSAYENGILHGIDHKSFAPNEFITREQMAMMIVNALQLETVQVIPTRLSFIDQEMISIWAQSAVFTAVENGMLAGYPNNTIKPKAHATRAEAVTIILNAQKKK